MINIKGVEMDLKTFSKEVAKHVIKENRNTLLNNTESIYDEEQYRKTEILIREAVRKALHEHNSDIEDTVVARLIGLDILDPLTKDPEISEIMVNKRDEILIERNGITKKTDLKFESDEELKELVFRIFKNCGRSINYKKSIQKATLPEGSRVYATITPTTKFPVLNIRLGSKKVFTTLEFIELGFFNEDMALALEYCVKARLNIVICGRGSVGKTSLQRWLTQFIPHTERVITIEELYELFLERIHPNVVAMKESEHISIYDLLKHATGMKADRIIIGEALGKEVYEFIFAMTTGHVGMTTIHTDQDHEVAFERIVQAAALSSHSEPRDELRRMIMNVIDIMVFIEKYPDGRRSINKITELINNDGKPLFNDIFAYDVNKRQHLQVGSFSTGLLRKMNSYLLEALPDKPYFNASREA